MLTQKDLAGHALNMWWDDSILGTTEATVLLGHMLTETKECVWEHIMSARLEPKAKLYMYSCFRTMVRKDHQDGGDRAADFLSTLSPSMKGALWEYVMAAPELQERTSMMLFGVVKRLGAKNDQESSESIRSFFCNISEEVRNTMLIYVARTYGTVHADNLLPKECHDMRDTVAAPLR